MKLTNEEFNQLKPYEEPMAIALRSKYARGIGRTEGEMMHRILVRVTKVHSRFNPSCSRCVYSLLCQIGKIYFADKAEKEAENAASKVKVEEKVFKVEKVEIKTESKPKTAKKKTASKKTTKK